VNILLIDDDIELIDFLTEILNSISEKYIIFISNTGESGISNLFTNSIDLIFLDIRLPDMNGLQIYEKIREISDNVPIILMSGYPLFEFSEDKNIYFLPKPFDYEDVDLILKGVYNE